MTRLPELFLMGLAPVGTFVVVLSLVFLSSCTQTTKVICPSLSPPPGSIVDALESTGRKDPSAAAWTIDLSKHYEKLDACR